MAMRRPWTSSKSTKRSSSSKVALTTKKVVKFDRAEHTFSTTHRLTKEGGVTNDEWQAAADKMAKAFDDTYDTNPPIENKASLGSFVLSISDESMMPGAMVNLFAH